MWLRQTGTAVTAADRGVVIRAGWNSQGYGQFVIVDHNIDYITLYAHLSEVLVEEGRSWRQVRCWAGSVRPETAQARICILRSVTFGRRVDPLKFLMQ
jgi:lipoprotein YgeR